MSNPQIQRYGVSKRWSDIVVHRDTAYFVEVPDDPTKPPADQFHQLFRQVEERLASVGSTKNYLLQVTIYLPFPEDLPTFNELWDQWIPDGHAPSRACIHTALAAPGYRAELILTAAVPNS